MWPVLWLPHVHACMHVPLILRYLRYLAAVVALDVFVVRSAAKRDHPSYRLWQESKGSDFVLEITSKHTRRDDQETKPRIYAALRVQEYFQYDPTGDYLQPSLQGFRACPLLLTIVPHCRATIGSDGA